MKITPRPLTKAEADRAFVRAQKRRWQEAHPPPPKSPRAPFTWKSLVIWPLAIAMYAVMGLALLFFIAAFLNA